VEQFLFCPLEYFMFALLFCVVPVPLELQSRIIFVTLFYSRRGASHPEILIVCYTVIIPAASQETVREAGIEPGTAALPSGSPSRLSQLSHYILKLSHQMPPTDPPHPKSHHIPKNFKGKRHLNKK
jgi:hypothetical protein